MIRDPVQRSSKLARLLGEISRRRALGAGEEGADGSRLPGADAGSLEGAGAAGGGEQTGRRGPGGERGAVPVGIEDILPGGVLEGPEGAVFLHERLRSAIERRRPGWGKLTRSRRNLPGGLPGPEWMWEEPEDRGWDAGSDGSMPDGQAGDTRRQAEEEAGLDAATLAPDVLHAELECLLRCDVGRIVFLDLETGGLGSACVFLAGTMRWNGEDYVLRQYFARHYGEESALLKELAAYLHDAGAIVTFNGKSFDVPLLRDRALRHRVDLRFPALHVDLLHHARAAWRGKLPNCRLVTLEAYVCRRRRSGDIPGDEIPGLYHDYVRDGLAHRLIPIFHHNLLDVITMEELLRRLI